MSNTTFTLRPLTAEDVQRVQPHDAERAALLGESVALVGDRYDVVGAFTPEGDVAGWVVLDARDGVELAPQMKGLWVYPKYRRQHLGVQLTQAIERIAAGHGFDEVKLAVDPESPAAIPLYIALDYTPTGDHYTATLRDGTQQREAVYRKSLTIGR